jgi:hypothetical protein
MNHTVTITIPPLLTRRPERPLPTGYVRAKVCKRRRAPNELAKPMTAIRNACLECMGYNAAEITRCTAPECWLFPYRAGHRPGAFPETPQKGGLGVCD